MCNKGVTTCCMQCSTPGNIVALHKRNVAYAGEDKDFQCQPAHAKNPTWFPRGKKDAAGRAPPRAGAAQPVAGAQDLEDDDGWLNGEI